MKSISTIVQVGAKFDIAVRFIKNKCQMLAIIYALKNTSFGVPNRRVPNQVFIVQLMAVEMDSYSLDPLD